MFTFTLYNKVSSRLLEGRPWWQQQRVVLKNPEIEFFFSLYTHAHVIFLVTISLWQADGKEGEPNAGRRASEERTEVST